MSLFGGVQLPGKPDLDNIEVLDRLAIPMIGEMERLGIAIDREYLWELSSILSTEADDLQKQIASYIPKDKLDEFSDRAADIEEAHGSATINASSADQIRELLFTILGLGKKRDLKKTATGKIKTDKKQLADIEEEHPIIRLIQDYRERKKLITTYCISLPKKAVFHPCSTDSDCPVCGLNHWVGTWRVHTQFLTTRTETRRLASKTPNLQNIPQRTNLGALVRAAFIATPGTKLVSNDFGQIELVDLAALAGCKGMIAVYAASGDLHLYTASACFNVPQDLVDKVSQRIPAKTVNFAIVYGISPKALSAQLRYFFSTLYSEGRITVVKYHDLIKQWSEDGCKTLIDKWFNIYPEILEYMDLQSYRARRYGFVWDVFGGVRLVPEIYSSLPYIKAAGIRQAGNMPIQATSAGQTKLAMGESQVMLQNVRENDGIWAWPLLTIHDQIMIEVEERYAEEIGDAQSEIFCNVMRDKETGENYWRVPITADAEIMDRWQKE